MQGLPAGSRVIPHHPHKGPTTMPDAEQRCAEFTPDHGPGQYTPFTE